MITEQIARQLKRKERGRNKEEYARLRKQISARDDKINPQHASNLRAATAEENLIAFLVHNPDKLTYIHERLPAEDFTTDFNRRLYEYFSGKILNNLNPMNSIAADFTADEQSQVVRIVNSYQDMTRTTQALDEYIAIIKDEASRPSEEDIRGFSNDDLTSYLKSMKDKKQ